MNPVQSDINTIRYHLGIARNKLKEQGKFYGEAFKIMWVADNHVESALNALIDLELKVNQV